MQSEQRIREHATAALDYALQAKVGLTMSGQAQTARDLDPLIQSLRNLLREFAAHQDSETGDPVQAGSSRTAAIYRRSSSCLKQSAPILARWPVASLIA